MVGIDRDTGQPIGLVESDVQAIERIVATPAGTRLFRRDFGNDGLLPDGRVDPDLSVAELEARAMAALNKEEPRATFPKVAAITNEGRVEGFQVVFDLKDEPGPRTALVMLPAYLV